MSQSNLISCTNCNDTGWLLWHHQFNQMNGAFYLNIINPNRQLIPPAKEITFEACKCQHGEKNIKHHEA